MMMTEKNTRRKNRRTHGLWEPKILRWSQFLTSVKDCLQLFRVFCESTELKSRSNTAWWTCLSSKSASERESMEKKKIARRRATEVCRSSNGRQAKRFNKKLALSSEGQKEFADIDNACRHKGMTGLEPWGYLSVRKLTSLTTVWKVGERKWFHDWVCVCLRESLRREYFAVKAIGTRPDLVNQPT